MPERIEFKFNRRFSSQSRNGFTFAWLKKIYDDHADDALIAAGSAFFYPIALYQSGASIKDVEAAIAQSRLLLETHLAVALGNCDRREEIAVSPEISEDIPQSMAVATNGHSTPPHSLAKVAIFPASSNGNGSAAIFPEIDQDRIYED